MSSLANNFISLSIQISALILFIKILLNESIKLNSLKNIIFFVIIIIISLIFFNEEYKGLDTLLFFLLIILLLLLVYKMKMSLAFITSGLFMLTLFIGDVIASILFINVFSINQIREFMFICSNFVVCAITIGIVSVKKIKEYYLNIIRISTGGTNLDTVIFILLLILVLSIIMYEITKSYFLGSEYILSIFAILIFAVLFIIYFTEKYEKDKLIIKYDQLFDYVQTFEKWIDNEKLNIHESKNQLATLRDMVKRNKKATEYIDNIIKERINIESQNLQKLKYVPNGGLKGLLFYKITRAENEGIDLFVDISKNVYSLLEKFNIEENKTLCRLVGIFFDNAIEASKMTPRKIISCEIYDNNKYLVIAISNTFSGSIEINKIYQNGYSTKGKNRGKGLYLAEKISKKDSIFLLDTRIINEYYIQKIIIEKEKIYK